MKCERDIANSWLLSGRTIYGPTSVPAKRLTGITASSTRRKSRSERIMAKTRAEKLRTELRRLNFKAKEVIEARDRVADKLKQCEDSEIRWTSHGLLRYLTRVKKCRVDEEALLAEVVTDELQDLVDTLGGTGRFPCGDYTLILREHCIVTVLTKDEDQS